MRVKRGATLMGVHIRGRISFDVELTVSM